jgi:PPIC-type PPIASE domain
MGSADRVSATLSRTPWTLYACTAAALGLAWLTACGGAAEKEVVVARVGGAAVTKAMLDHWAALGSAPDRATRTRQALETLIAAAWTIGEARAAGIAVSGAEARAQLNAYSTDLGTGRPYPDLAVSASFGALLARAEGSSEDRAWLMKLNLLAWRLEQRRVREAEQAVDQAAVARFYSKHRGRFVVPEQRDIEVLGNYSLAAVRQARREIEAGADFIAVARRLSTDQEAPNGLQLALQRGEEEPEYIAHIFAAKPGVLVGPVKQSFYYLFRVMRVRPSHLRTLAQSQATIRQLIVAPRRRTLIARWARAEAERWRARTECRAPYAVAACAGLR